LAPLILEPEEGRIFNPSNVHLETEPFADPNGGDQQRCTDWEIWTVSPPERVWTTLCITGALAVHTHLGDGVFEGSHAGRRQLLPETEYKMRVRFRDSSGVPATEWSEWSERAFATGALSQLFPMLLLDAMRAPGPTLRAASGRAGVLLPSGDVPAELRLERTDSSPFFVIEGGATGNTLLDFGSGIEHSAVRVVIRAGTVGLDLGENDLIFSSEDLQQRAIYLPALHLSPGENQAFWVADNGGTYAAHAGESTPVFTELRREAAVPWTVAPDFQADVVARGFTLPVSIAFIPEPGPDPGDPLFYVAELYGTLKVVRRNGEVSDYTTQILDFTPTGVFPGSGEQGVGSVVVDPKTGDVFASLVYSEDPRDPGAPLYGAVDRFVSTDGGLTAATRYRVLDMAPEPQGPAHQPSNVTFGPDGYLYVHTGDGIATETAQDLSLFRGKILRMTRGGAAVGTNPYYNPRDGITARDYVYAYGIRNAFGGAWRQSDGAHYFVENGPSVDRFARLVYARNYGWDGSDQSMAKYALFNWSPAASPVNITFIEGERFEGSGFPEYYRGRAYVTQFCCGGGPGGPQGKSITEWSIDREGRLEDGSRSVAYYNGAGIATPVAIATGPDGIYFSDFFGEPGTDVPGPIAKVLRLRYRAPEPPPDCDIDGVPDAEALASGSGLDCNFNGVPDECDIAASRELDCDRDGVPDRCEETRSVGFDFTNGATPFVLSGTAQALDGAIRLTPAVTSATGSAVLSALSQRPMDQLRVEFDFRIGGGSGADGLSFAAFDSALYPDAPLFGEDGPGVGSLVVKLNTFNNGDGANNIQILFNGQTIGSATPNCQLNDGLVHTVHVSLTGQHMNVTLSCQAGSFEPLFSALEVPGFVPFVANFGFGGRTGGLVDEHWIDNVVFWMPVEDDTDSTVPDGCRGG
jgi:glucose/arabinose dehydrogenase